MMNWKEGLIVALALILAVSGHYWLGLALIAGLWALVNWQLIAMLILAIPTWLRRKA